MCADHAGEERRPRTRRTNDEEDRCIHGGELGLADLRAWAKQHLAPYKVPTLLRVVAEIPRNSMGKVVKPDLVADLVGV